MKLWMRAAVVTLSLFALVSSLSAQRVDVDAIRKAADQGLAVAQNDLGALYQGGQGVAQDYAQAAIWYRKAADQGFAAAQFNLGKLYQGGQGVAQDYAQAAIWYHKAADQGLAVAQNDLGTLYWSGNGVPQDYAQCAIWFHKAADQGHAGGQYNLGILYALGYGVPQDSAQAEIYLRKAADQGYQPARDRLQSIQAARLAQANAQTQAHPIGTIQQAATAGGSSNAQNQVPSAQSLPDVIAMLESAKSKQVKLSGEEMSKYADSQYQGDTRFLKWNLKHCNQNGFDNGYGNTSNICGHLAGHIVTALGVRDPRVEVAYQRACASIDTGSAPQPWCSMLGDLYKARGEWAMALAVYQQAPNCNQEFNFDRLRAACLRGAAGVLRQLREATQEQAAVQVLCKKFSEPDACARLNELGGSADVEQATARYNATQQREHDANAERIREEEAAGDAQRAESRERLGALRQLNDQVSQGGTALLNTGNEQAAAIRAVGDANAAAQWQAEQQRVAAQQPQQQRASQQRQAAQQSGSNTSSTHDTYAPALDVSCVHALWDASSYGWLAFDNACGQKISLLVLLNDNTHFGVSSPGISVLEPGERLNTTTTRSAVQAHKGYTMYACPYPMSAVGPDNKLVEEINVSSYRCWRP